jgi:basic membrane protein A
MKRIFTFLFVFSLVGTVCFAGGSQETSSSTSSAPAKSTEATASYAGKVGLVLDTGGVDDKGFNQSAWEGAQKVAKTVKWQAVYLQSQQQADFEKNINELLSSKCDLIVTVGFLMGDAVAAASDANPQQKFLMIDYSFSPPKPNVLGQLWAMEQGSYLAGYLAAGMTKTGVVGSFGGMNIPPVADFFIGFAQGIEKYNQVHGTKVRYIGWSNKTLDGLFVGSFSDTEGARRYTENLIDEGADIILPQSGPEALAAAAVIKQKGGIMAIGADTDQYATDQANGSVYLTSIVKNVGLAVIDSVQAVANGTFKGGTKVATLAGGGLGLAPFHSYNSSVPASLKQEIEQIKQDIISGKIVVDNWASLSAKK